MKFCTNCGYKMNDDVRFCPKCGTPQDSVAQDSSVSESSDSGRFQGGSEFDKGSNYSQNNSTDFQQPKQSGFDDKLQQNDYNGQRQNGFYNDNQRQGYQQQKRQTYDGEFTIGQPQHLDFSQSMSYIWQNKFDFSPTVQDNQKSIFWWSQLMVAILGMAVYIILGIPASALGSGFLTIIMLLLELALWLMEIPPIMRRLNYLGQNKNMAWLFFVPVAQIYIWYLMCIDRGQVNHA